MLFSEQVRLLESEERLINDSAEYAILNGDAWKTAKNYGNITLTEAGLVAFNYDARCNTHPTATVYSRLKVGSYYVHGANPYGQSWSNYHGLIWLAAGTYAVVMELRAVGINVGASVRNFQLGKAKFSDSEGEALAAYSGQISKTVSSRKLAVGSLKQAVFCIHVFAYTPGGQTNFENPGESLTNGVSISIDSVQVSWSERYQDDQSKENAYAKCYYPVAVGGTHTIAIAKDNANTVVHVSAVCSPWILSNTLYEPVSAGFPQLSTFYAILEPLSGNVTKNACVGKTRAVSFGDSTDYYSSSNGTGILSYSYTFESVAVDKIGIFFSGLGGCLSIIAVDVR